MTCLWQTRERPSTDVPATVTVTKAVLIVFGRFSTESHKNVETVFQTVMPRNRIYDILAKSVTRHILTDNSIPTYSEQNRTPHKTTASEQNPTETENATIAKIFYKYFQKYPSFSNWFARSLSHFLRKNHQRNTNTWTRNRKQRESQSKQ